MATESEILLRIKRQLSKSEKYRFVLNYLNSIEVELARERKLNTELMKEKSEFQQQINDLDNKNESLEVKLKKFETLQSQNNFISPDTHRKALDAKNEFQKKYSEQVRKNIELQHQIDKFKNI